ncbi:hypothetical protein LOK49_LG10G02408 [Camellia lanceoleosa]|uniref:Uncharacterized protein n=1 Tax=Camellia lanceoleosa TaxID=1840588 RepID=A0ACC0GF34_9ERIC|nr:hypothetical protein LOK49_LG10G02408 [Camellia lanceoleosa]
MSRGVEYVHFEFLGLLELVDLRGLLSLSLCPVLRGRQKERKMAAPEAPICYVGIVRKSAAFRLMKQMGWKEGEGLGKEKQGIKGYVRVKDKQTLKVLFCSDFCIGVDELINNWAFDTSQFDNILKRLKVDDVQDVDLDATTETNLVVKSTRPQGRQDKGLLKWADGEVDVTNEVLGNAPTKFKGKFILTLLARSSFQYVQIAIRLHSCWRGEAALETKNNVEEDVADLTILLDVHEFLMFETPTMMFPSGWVFDVSNTHDDEEWATS